MSKCPSCREPLDYPSGDGCAAMTLHKESVMTDLIKRDDAPEKIVAWGWSSPKTSGCYPHECHWMGAGYAHYIRADLADPAAIREAALRDALATVQWLKDEFEARGSPTAGRVLAHTMERIEALIGETK